MNEIKIINKSMEYADSFRDALDSVARERTWLALTEAAPYEKIREFVKELIDENDIQVYAVLGDKVIGWCDVIRRQREHFAHTASLGMGIIKPHRGKGIGSMMMEEVIKQSRAAGLEKISLEVYSHNTGAVALYRKFGFIEEGLKIREVKINGIYYNEYVMGLLL